MTAIGTILGTGDGYKQSVQVEFKQAKTTSKDQNVEVIATAAAGMSAQRQQIG